MMFQGVGLGWPLVSFLDVLIVLCYTVYAQRMQGAFMYVFYREDRDPRLVYLFSSYEESTNTKHIVWKGKSVCGLFLNKDTAKMVALQQGWKDISDDWNKEDESNEDQTQTIIEENETKESATVVEKTVKPKKRTKRKAKK